MSPSYKGFELIEFDMCHMDMLYECRNIPDFDNFWFFPKSHVSGTELVDELKTLIQDEVVYDLFIIVKNGNKLGFLLSYNYVDSSNMISLSIYLKSEYRNGFNLLYPFLLIFDYYQVKLKIQKFKLSVYNANKFVVNFLNRFSFFELVSRDRVYSEFILCNSQLPYIFEKCKYTRNNDKNFYLINDFPLLKSLELHHLLICKELISITNDIMEINRGFKSHEKVKNEVISRVEKGEKYGWIQGWDYDNLELGNKNWLQYGLMFNDSVPDFIEIKLPFTTNLLKSIKGINVAAFVKLKPKTIIHCHTHPEIKDEQLLQLHLTLNVSEKNNFAYLNVNGEFKQHILGKAIIFDGSLPHFALNESNQDRIILYLEFSKKLMFQN